MQIDPLSFENYNLRQISFELAEERLATYKMDFNPQSRKRIDGTFDRSAKEDYIEPYVALRESFNDIIERYNTENSPSAIMRYQREMLPDFIVDGDTFKSRMFLVRLDLRTLAASLLELPVNLVGIIPAVENMPSGTAYRPGDVLTASNGMNRSPGETK